MCKSVSSNSVHGTDMSLHRRLDEQTVLVTAVIVVVNHGLQIIRIFLHKLENLIFLGTKPLNLLHPFIFLCSIGISLPDEFFLTHVSIGILLIQCNTKFYDFYLFCTQLFFLPFQRGKADQGFAFPLVQDVSILSTFLPFGCGRSETKNAAKVVPDLPVFLNGKSKTSPTASLFHDSLLRCDV